MVEEQFLQRKKRIIEVIWVSQIAMVLAALHPVLNGEYTNLSILLSFTLLMFFAYFQARKNKLNVAANLIILILTALILIMSWTNDGVRDEVLLVLPALVAFSVLTGSKNLFKYVFVIAVINIFLMGYLNEIGYIQHKLSNSGLSPAFIVIIILTVVTYAIKILGGDLHHLNYQLRKQQETLEHTVEERTKELQNSLHNLKVAQSELVQSEKMASLGKLVGGIAHEINTPIGIAITASTFIKESNQQLTTMFNSNKVSKSNFQKYLENTDKSADLIFTNLQRAEGLILDFKDAAVLQTDHRIETIAINTFIEETITSLQPNLEQNAYKVIFDFQEGIEVEQDPVIIGRIITNFFTNSLRHGFKDKTEGEIKIVTKADNKKVTIIYSDNGHGISEENINQIFEPFFTTMRGKGGTGLGLNLVYNLITQSLNGSIKCTSTLGEGAKFEISFPMINKVIKEKA